MNDRRRINAPGGGTAPPIFASTLPSADQVQSIRPSRSRKPDELSPCTKATLLKGSRSRLDDSAKTPVSWDVSVNLQFRPKRLYGQSRYMPHIAPVMSRAGTQCCPLSRDQILMYGAVGPRGLETATSKCRAGGDLVVAEDVLVLHDPGKNLGCAGSRAGRS